MALNQEKVLKNIDKLINSTSNFPFLLHEAEEKKMINRLEKEAILTKYKSLYDKLTTFYILVGSKGAPTISKLPGLLQLTGNSAASHLLCQSECDPTGSSLEDSRSIQILENLERLCSHTVNPGLIFTFATGLELITGMERELIEKQCRSEERQVEAFYRLVALKGDSVYDNLVQVLRMTQNYWALEVLHYEEMNEK